MNVMKGNFFCKRKKWRNSNEKNFKPSFSTFNFGSKYSSLLKNSNLKSTCEKNLSDCYINFFDDTSNIISAEDKTEGASFVELLNVSKDDLSALKSISHSKNAKADSFPDLKLIEGYTLRSLHKEKENLEFERLNEPSQLSSDDFVHSKEPTFFDTEMFEGHHTNNREKTKIVEGAIEESVMKTKEDINSRFENFKSNSTTPNRFKSRSFSFSSDPKTPKMRKSPKTPNSSKILNSGAGAFILAVTEGRGHARGEVGIAAMDPKRPQLVLCQISDSQRYVHSLTKMNVFDFVEVIVPNTFVDCSGSNKLYRDIRSRFPTVTLTSVQRRHFSEAVGVDLIKQYGSSETASVMVLLRDKFYALSAAAALIKYIEFSQSVRLAPHSLRIEYQGIEDTMVIDLDTANLLELVMCTNHPQTNINYSLLGVVNHCRTRGGSRLLKANILQPPCSLPKIEARLDCVTELINNPLLLYSLEAAIGNFSNLESLLSLCTHAPQKEGIRVAEYQLKYTLLLKTALEFLPGLSASLKDAKSNYFRLVLQNLQDSRYELILARILQTVLENAKTVKGSVAAHLHGCFCIKSGINSLLDVAKTTYCEIVQQISDHITKLRETHGIPLRISFSTSKGFHIQYTVPLNRRNLKESDLPKEFILVQKSKSTFTFYTAELVALDQRSQQVLDEIKLMTNAILFELLNDIRQHIGCLYNLCECISELDILVSFARVGSGKNYVRPDFGNELLLKDSKHPILDVVYDGEVVPNDAFANSKQNFMILTGPNQSGKSVYIRQIALLQIMAQIGCYVPAKKAKFRLSDRIFSRIAFDDDIENNASTLMVEMKDVEYLKQNITSRSLVIVDELCRGTSVDEGTSLAFAVAEQLLDTSAYIFFTTHYLFLTKLEEMYFNVTNFHFETKMDLATTSGKPNIQFTHLRKPGVTTADLYGLQVAELTSFPKDITTKAKEISVELCRKRKASRSVSNLLAKYRLALKFKKELLEKESSLETIIKKFKHLYLSLSDSEDLNEIELSRVSETTINCFKLQERFRKMKKADRKSKTWIEITSRYSTYVPNKTKFIELSKPLILKLSEKIKRKYKKLLRTKKLFLKRPRRSHQDEKNIFSFSP